MSEASAHKLSYSAETTRGTMNATPTFIRLPDTRTTVALVKDTLATERLTGDRFPAAPRTGATTVAGDIPVDLSYDTYNPFIESALQGAFDASSTNSAKAGTTRKSFSILREFSDITTDQFHLYTGCEVASWSLTAAANGLAKSTFTFMGRGAAAPASVAPSSSTFTAASTTEPFDTFSGEMKIDGVASCIVTDYTINVNNGLEARYAVGCEGSEDPTVSQSIVDGSLTVYLEDMTLYKKFINDQSIALSLKLMDSSSQYIRIDIPNAVISSGTQPDVTGDGAIMLPISFTAHYDSTLQSHIEVTSLS
tara:strand:+ start:197 stop:1120 length:924 start_codon:yes stop_codon:yes gene_type:complete